ncbi:MAG: hypothetical protein L0H94_12970 [Nitrospira sp.]|nr:hypothetical protein [Nitrospira sp.]
MHEIISKVEKPTINTDPWIFHPDFVWTTCRHKKADDARAGDIVLFGSVVEGNWVLDTVFVIDNRLENIPKGKFGLAYDVLVGDTFKTKQCPRPFVGKPFQATHKPFSFKCLSG